MSEAEVTEVTTTRTKSKKVLETKQIVSLQEIIRRMKASPQMNGFDPIIYRKLMQLSKN